MRFTDHSRYSGLHAFLSASDYHWVNYTEDKLDRVFHTKMTAKRGTELHKLAHDLIRLGVRLPDNGTTLSLYVNDAIGYRMVSEQMLMVSENCFGTPDSISFRDKLLRIHDLKNGVNEASMMQPKVYAAMFCLEYNFRPNDIEMELRIYQNDMVRVEVADPDEIFHIIDRIIVFDRRINELRKEAA